MSRAVEAEPYDRAAVCGVLGLDFAPVSLGDLTHDREAETRAGHRAGIGRAVEPVEDQWPVLVGEPWPVIAHSQLAVVQRHLDRAAVPAPLAGVLEQVPDGALHAVLVAVDERRLEAVDLPRDLGEPRASPFDRVLDQLVELVLRSLDLRAAAGELEQTGNQRTHLL